MTITAIPKPHTHVADLTHLPKALERIITQKRWVVWRWERRVKKNGAEDWTKPPYQCRHPNTPAKSNDPNTWDTYEAAIAAVAAGLADGIGFMLKNSEVAAADLDHVRNANTGELVGWARRLCAEADSLGLYREVTVSGCGLRFIGLSKGSELHRKFTVSRKSRAGIELYRNTCRYITISGLQEGTCDAFGSIDDYLDALLARFDQPTTTKPQNDYYRDLIQNGCPEGERSEKFQEVVWHLASQGRSIEDIVDELAKYPNGIGLKYATRLPAEVTRSFGKWQSRQSASAAGSAAAAGTPWPQIRIISGELPRVINEAEDALLQYDGNIYQRGGLVVRPVLTKYKASDEREAQGWQLIPVIRPYLVDVLTCAARFWKYDKRAQAWVPVDCPDKVAETYLARRGCWKLPVLSGIVHTPLVRADGTVCEAPGYDQASGLLFKPEGEVFPPVPLQPNKADASAALAELEKLIATFPFVAEADRAVALSAILTTLDRRSMATAPLHAFTTPVAGTGKSLLVDLCALLATGRLMPVIAQGRSEEELEKRLGTELLAGKTAISLDNCDHTLEGVFLCQVLTQQQVNIRILGQSRSAETPTNATFFATGNNLGLSGDITRRALLCAMDAQMERPETRKFAETADKIAKRLRGELVTAALTVLRAWHASGERMTLSAFGSFEEWSYRIRAPLVWLGKVDPCETLGEIRENDPSRGLLVAVIEQWKANLKVGTTYSVQDVIERAVNVPTFYTALMNVAGSRSGQSVSNERLGRWLKRVQGKMVGNLMLRSPGKNVGHTVWVLTQV